jgi:exodeoxyribonuclease-1
MVLPLARHPVNGNGILVYDLRHDPGPFLGLDVEGLRERLFTPAAELPEGAARLPVKTVHLNKCPVLVPLSTLTERAAEEWGIDPARGGRHAAAIGGAGDWPERVARCFAETPFGPETDPDASLYGGGFFSDADRRLIEQVRAAEPADLAALRPPFEDPRLPEMLFRYRARNWPESLSREERAPWG